MDIMMQHSLHNTISLLTRTPAALNALLRDLPEIWTLRSEGEKSWNAFDVVGHLIHADRTDWMPRAKTILQFGETKPFDAFDRLGQVRESQGRSLAQLLDEFALVRSENLDELRALNLQPQDLARRGRHPALGTVTLSELLATWAAHDLTHLHQISRIMAHQLPRGRRPIQRISRGDAVRGPQLSLMNSAACRVPRSSFARSASLRACPELVEGAKLWAGVSTDEKELG
jgi:hypothetical protein